MTNPLESSAWPPSHLAVLQDGNGLPPYYRPKLPAESDEDFTERIAEVAVVGMHGPSGTTFQEIIDGETGLTDEAATELVTSAMRALKLSRSQVSVRLAALASKPSWRSQHET